MPRFVLDLLFAGLGVLFLAACQADSMTPLDGPSARFAKPPGTPGGGGGGSSSTPDLVVTIPAGFDVTSDGISDYTHDADDVEAQIFGTDNFGLDVRGPSKGKGKKNAVDRRVCLQIRSWPDGTPIPAGSGEDGCLDVNVTTSDPDDPPGGFTAMSTGETMTTSLRFLWAGPDGADRWIRFGSTCEFVGTEWVPHADSRADVTATSDGWTIEAGDAGAFWCRNAPDSVEPHPLAGNADGRVLVTLRFEASPL